MTDEQIYTISTILQSEWANAAIKLDLVRGEKDDGSKDWQLFHGDRLIGAIRNEKMLRSLLDAYVKENREVINKVFGL